MTLFHVTTEKLARQYRETGYIRRPVCGFTTPLSALLWSVRTGRKVIYRVTADDSVCHKLPDHHNAFGEAWWADADILDFECIFSPQRITKTQTASYLAGGTQ